jgi:hypothetical protein
MSKTKSYFQKSILNWNRPEGQVHKKGRKTKNSRRIRRKKKKKKDEATGMKTRSRSFTIYTPHILLFWWLMQGRDGLDM